MNAQKSLLIVIALSAVAISGSLIFLGSRIPGSGKADVITPTQEGQDDIAIAPIVDYADDDPFIGDANAPVTIVEWSDYECPFCERFAKTTLPQIKEAFIDTGKARLVYRDFPLSSHKNATPAALAAACARDQGGDEMYFQYHDLIFENQSNLSSDLLKQFAIDLNLDSDSFNECLDSEKYKPEIAQDLVDGQAAGVRGTPAFLINGELVYGAQPFEVFEEVINNLL